MEKIFKLKENGTTIGTEIRAGFTTFFAMAYIILLNPVFLSSTGMNADGVLVATCISAAVGTLLCAFVSNKPFAMASGMGMNAFFAYTLCGAYGYTWQQALSITLMGGIIFLFVAASPLRNKIIDAIPLNLKYAISAGIGFFIAVIGLLDAGIVTMEAGIPAFGNVHELGVKVALFGLAVTTVLVVIGVKGSLIIGMIITVIASMAVGATEVPEHIIGSPGAISQVFFKMDFSGLTLGESGPLAVFKLIAVLLSISIVDMFDTLGFLIGTGSRAGMIEKDGKMPWAGKVLVADSIGTVCGSLLGTSTVTCYAESAAGIAAGGKTGLTSFTVAICFIFASFFSPLTTVMTSAVTAPALIIVGMYLVSDIKKISFENMDDAIPAFLTIVVTPFAYSITTGIAAGFISFVICKIAARKQKEITIPVIALAVIFVVYFLI